MNDTGKGSGRTSDLAPVFLVMKALNQSKNFFLRNGIGIRILLTI